MVVILLGGCSVLTALLVLHYFSGAEQLFRCSLANAGLGLASFLLVNGTAFITGVSLPCSLLSLCVSLSGGPAGAALLVALQAIFV